MVKVIMEVTKDTIEKLLRKDENGAYIDLVIPKDYYGDEIVLTGKTDRMLDLEEIFRFKKYIGSLWEKIVDLG